MVCHCKIYVNVYYAVKGPSLKHNILLRIVNNKDADQANLHIFVRIGLWPV